MPPIFIARKGVSAFPAKATKRESPTSLRSAGSNAFSWTTLAEGFSHDAGKVGFPNFPVGVAASTPLNSAPFLARLDTLRDRYTSQTHVELLDALEGLIQSSRDFGVRLRVGLLGGSFTDQSARPRDLDCVLFYENARTCGAPPLGKFVEIARAQSLDVRMVPLDASPLVTLKSAVFFGLLYAQSRGGAGGAGLLLLDLDDVSLQGGGG